MSDTSSSHLQTARAALDRCQDLLADETPEWAELHAALQTAQRAIAVAEYCSEVNVPAPAPEIESESFPNPVVAEPVVPKPVEPEPVAPESQPLPAPEPVATVEPEPLPAAGASLAERLSEQRLDSLKNSLSINNRVRFASLLTDGDVPALLNLCDALEASDSFEAAQVLILETSGDVDWDDEENGGVEFLSLVRRLFATA
ncbi:MAG: hypothetical protein ACPG08_06250 [Flavobacteriales bacterium]